MIISRVFFILTLVLSAGVLIEQRLIGCFCSVKRPNTGGEAF